MSIPSGWPTDPFAPPVPPRADPDGSPQDSVPAATNPYDAPAYAAAPYAGQLYPGQPYAQPYPAQPYPGQPYPGQPYAQQYGTAPTNGLAIGSLVSSLVAFVIGISAPVGLVLGIVALRQIRRDGSQGRGMAIAGIVIGSLITACIVLVVVVIILAITFGEPSSASWSVGLGA